MPALSRFSLGILRGNGLLGGLAAWTGFTSPSALIVLAFAFERRCILRPMFEGFLHGLKLIAVAVVAQAVWGMAQTLTPDRQRAAIAIAALMIAMFIGGSLSQIGAIAGLWLCKGAGALASGDFRFPISRLQGALALLLFIAFFVLPPLVAATTSSPAVAIFEAFYRSGVLVFGGGHVVLPLLQNTVVTPAGFVTRISLRATALPKRCPDRCSHSPPIWVPSSVFSARRFIILSGPVLSSRHAILP